MNLAIIIPSYNSNSSLSKLIEIINRDYSKSIIVIDDGSDEVFSSQYDNVDIIRNKENKGNIVLVRGTVVRIKRPARKGAVKARSALFLTYSCSEVNS